MDTVKAVKIVTGVDHDLKELGSLEGIKVVATNISSVSETINGIPTLPVRDDTVKRLLEAMLISLSKIEETLNGIRS